MQFVGWDVLVTSLPSLDRSLMAASIGVGARYRYLRCISVPRLYLYILGNQAFAIYFWDNVLMSSLLMLDHYPHGDLCYSSILKLAL